MEKVEKMFVIVIFAVTVVLIASCGDNLPGIIPGAGDRSYDAGPPDAMQTEIFYKCEDGVTCSTGQCSKVNHDDAGPEVCTVPCETQDDCKQHHINSICLCTPNEEHICYYNDPEHGTSPGHCTLLCWPEEIRETCDYYDIFCPSDCEAQGLTCQLTTIWPFYYTCK